jgi:hypothetical protein
VNEIAPREGRTCFTPTQEAHIFDETFGVNSTFNAEVFIAAPHAVAMESDLFGERRSGHWVKGRGVSKSELLVG